jgi:septal ring factor EnvC (AmiA/AmiB activator)
MTGDHGRPRAVRPFEKARGAMVYPASGTLALRYGELDEFGVSSKGLTLITRAGAVVVAPYDGQVEFAGPFKGYGQILIIQHGDGYHSLLAGLDRIDGAVGDWLVAGEPVGAMGSGEPKPRLYLELRHNGQPINPLPWLATRDEKVSG